METKRVKILMITTIDFGFNGITNVIMNYFRALDRTDLQMDFVIQNHIRSDLKNEIHSSGSNVYEFRGRNKSPISYVNWLTDLIRENNYEIVHAHGNSCTLALEMYAANKGGARVRIPHSHNSTCKHRVAHRILRRMFNKNYTHGFACGEKAGNWLYEGEKFSVINNGIDVENFMFDTNVRAEYRKKYGLTNKKVIGHIGHFTLQKNHDFLIDIFQQLYKIDKDYRLILLGDGSLRPDIEKKVKSLGLVDVVKFTGATLETSHFMQAMDILVMPSKYEGLPLTLIESQASGLPCYVADTVSKESKITELVEFMSLDLSAEKWAKKINSSILYNRNNNKDQIHKNLVDSGFSINNNAKILKKLYLSDNLDKDLEKMIRRRVYEKG
ncbi:glycosyltransferase family 1 protein [Bacillus sp. NTK071]|uniref:glycosyltransferase family 1 protein n=1 Tax=Bacillus sp. NTK071 TaxID=2802175 RepID=UPI001A8E0BFC|nr:glycosyltransferase family 1 protein [Bacillus sp. NTK071]MBN8210245.1 glycosyltransferase family 1 protein [Bacillus sp. NTK071]